jgi:alkylation response protein AidB-like acyl-CoA dehydrogenase
MNVEKKRADQTLSDEDMPLVHEGLRKIFTIFEGTSEIQRLVVARAISGMYIK